MIPWVKRGKNFLRKLALDQYPKLSNSERRILLVTKKLRQRVRLKSSKSKSK